MNKALAAALIVVCFFLVFCPFQLVRATTYTYTLNGPFFDSGGGFATGNTALLTFVYTDGSSFTSALSSSSPVPYSLAKPLSHISWNASTALNLTRSIYINSTLTSDSEIIFIPDTSTKTAGIYYISVTDYTGSVLYLQTSQGNFVVERKPIETSGIISFVLTQYESYTLTAIGTMGSLSQSLLADNVLSMNLPILPGSFPSTNYGYGAYASVTRYNSTAVQANFTDSSSLTSWAWFNIYHKDGLANITDDIFNTTSLPVSLVWNGADSSKDYYVHIQSLTNSSLRDWYLPAPAINSNSNPWTSIIAPFASSIPTLPLSNVLPQGFAIEQIPAAAIIALVLAIFSYVNHEIGCLLAWIVALIMVWLGWFTVSAPAFGFALFVSVLIAFEHGKRTEREL